jgi:hypothetical protein
MERITIVVNKKSAALNAEILNEARLEVPGLKIGRAFVVKDLLPSQTHVSSATERGIVFAVPDQDLHKFWSAVRENVKKRKVSGEDVNNVRWMLLD